MNKRGGRTSGELMIFFFSFYHFILIVNAVEIKGKKQGWGGIKEKRKAGQEEGRKEGGTKDKR